MKLSTTFSRPSFRRSSPCWTLTPTLVRACPRAAGAATTPGGSTAPLSTGQTAALEDISNLESAQAIAICSQKPPMMSSGTGGTPWWWPREHRTTGPSTTPPARILTQDVSEIQRWLFPKILESSEYRVTNYHALLASYYLCLR